jgi:predicted double-glycine peptidase
VTSLKEARFRSTVRQQYDFSCGSAALSTLLSHHYQYAVAEDAIFSDMFARGDRARIQKEGFSLLDLKLYLEAHGFTADGFEAPLDSLETAGIPAIVLVKENGYSHFVVVKGLRADRVLIGDPASGTRSMPRNRFESLRVNQILFVITNKTDVARFNVASDWNAAPGSPIVDGINRDGVGASLLMKRGPSDF